MSEETDTLSPARSAELRRVWHDVYVQVFAATFAASVPALRALAIQTINWSTTSVQREDAAQRAKQAEDEVVSEADSRGRQAADFAVRKLGGTEALERVWIASWGTA